MGTRLIGSILTIGAVFAISGVVIAQTTQQPRASSTKANPRTPDGKPDFNGVWGTPLREEAPDINKRFPRPKFEPMSLTPWAQEILTYNTDPRPGFNVRPELNPEYKCIPDSLIRLLSGVASYDAFEIIQSPKRVLVFFQRDHTIRQIWTDGRKLPEPDELDLTWMGHSIGRWDGDTLVVDTIGMRTENWLTPGVPHSEAMHVTERYRRIDHDYLQIDVTVEDPKTLTKPWSTRFIRIFRPDGELYQDSRCYPGDAEWKANEELFSNPTTQR